MAPETRSKGKPPASRVYYSSPTVQQVHFPASRRIVKTYGRRSLGATTGTAASRTLYQQTLTQMTFVPSSSRDAELAEGEEQTGDGAVTPGPISRDGGKVANARTRRRTAGDEADGDVDREDAVSSSRFRTQTLTQFLGGPKAESRAATAAKGRQPLTIEDSQEEDASRISRGRFLGSIEVGDDGDDDESDDDNDTDTSNYDVDDTGNVNLDQGSTFSSIFPPSSSPHAGARDKSSVTRDGVIKRAPVDKNEEPHTPSTKRRCIEIPSSAPSIGSPLTPMLRRYSPLRVSASPLKYKSPHVSSSHAIPVPLSGLPPGLRSKSQQRLDSGTTPRETMTVPILSPTSAGILSQRVLVEIPDSQEVSDSDEEIVVGEDLAALEAKVLGRPSRLAKSAARGHVDLGSGVWHKSREEEHANLAEADVRENENMQKDINTDVVKPRTNRASDTAAVDRNGESIKGVSDSDDEGPDLDENATVIETQSSNKENAQSKVKIKADVVRSDEKVPADEADESKENIRSFSDDDVELAEEKNAVPTDPDGWDKENARDDIDLDTEVHRVDTNTASLDRDNSTKAKIKGDLDIDGPVQSGRADLGQLVDEVDTESGQEGSLTGKNREIADSDASDSDSTADSDNDADADADADDADKEPAKEGEDLGHETCYEAGFETQAILEQVLARSERERTSFIAGSAPSTSEVASTTALPRYAWTRKLAKHAPPVEFQTQLDSQRVPLDTIRGMKAPNRRSDLWLSLKPEVVEQIVCGAKTHDFRSWLNPEVQRFWIFESRPTWRLRYMADVGPRAEPGELSERGLGNKEFNAGKNGRYAHVLAQVYELNDPVSLADMIECGWVDAAPERQNEFVPPAIVAQLLANLRWALFAEEGEQDEEELGAGEPMVEEQSESTEKTKDDTDTSLGSSPPTRNIHPVTQQLHLESLAAQPRSARVRHRQVDQGLGPATGGASGAGGLFQAKQGGGRRRQGQQQQQQPSREAILVSSPQVSCNVPASSSPPACRSKVPASPLPRLPPPRTPSKSKVTNAPGSLHQFTTPKRPIPRQSQISTLSGGSSTSRFKVMSELPANMDSDAVETPSPTPRRPRRPARESSNLTSLPRTNTNPSSDTGVMQDSQRFGMLSSSQRLPDSLVRDDGREPPTAMVVWDSQGEGDTQDDERGWP